MQNDGGDSKIDRVGEIMPKVSIVVPIYNVEKYLRQCMDSILNQTLADIEVICVDDGSTDSSPEILKEYAAKDTRVTVYYVYPKEDTGEGLMALQSSVHY